MMYFFLSFKIMCYIGHVYVVVFSTSLFCSLATTRFEIGEPECGWDHSASTVLDDFHAYLHGTKANELIIRNKLSFI